MKEMNLNFFGLKAKIVLPLLMFFGLFMLGANSVAAQSFKPQGEAQTIVKNELFLVQELGGQAYGVQVSASTSLVAKYEYLTYLNMAVQNADSVQTAVNGTYQKMTTKFPTGPMRTAIELIHLDMVQKLKS